MRAFWFLSAFAGIVLRQWRFVFFAVFGCVVDGLFELVTRVFWHTCEILLVAVNGDLWLGKFLFEFSARMTVVFSLRKTV